MGNFSLPYLLIVAIVVSTGQKYLHRNNIKQMELKPAKLFMDKDRNMDLGENIRLDLSNDCLFYIKAVANSSGQGTVQNQAYSPLKNRANKFQIVATDEYNLETHRNIALEMLAQQ